MATTFSTVGMRERDKFIEDKHKKELEAADRKFEKLKRILDDVDKQCFDLRNRAQQLAQSLGFSDFDEAQRAIDLSDHEVTFHEAFERVQILEKQIAEEQKQKESLQNHCQELKKLLHTEQKRSTSLEKSEQRGQQELRDIHAQYDALKVKAERAQDYFKQERRKLFKLHHWLCLEHVDPKKKTGQDVDYNKLQTQNTQHRKEILREFGPQLSDLLGLDIQTLDQKMEEAQVLVADFPPTGNSNSKELQAIKATTFRNPMTSPSPLPRQPLSQIQTTNDICVEPMDSSKQTIPKSPLPTNSSETEEDSQAPSQLFKAPPPTLIIPSQPSASSETETDSQAPASSPTFPPASSPSSVMKPLKFFPERFKYANSPSIPPINRPKCKVNITSFELVKPDELEHATGSLDDRRPKKKPRLILDSSVQTPKSTKTDFSLFRGVFSTSRVAKGKENCHYENTPLNKAKPLARTSGQTRMEDYTIYKGRGRYAKEDDVTTNTINALYTVNPERNGGICHQFEEVIRGRDDRMGMDAGDCDDCREWYAAVGPMPQRDQGPVWRSPSPTPVKRCQRHCRATSPAHDPDFSSSLSLRRVDIESHKKQISRHRQNWTRPRTPPGYWTIGFPDTQEAREINEQAEEMHRRKLREVEKEAERGKWIRK